MKKNVLVTFALLTALANSASAVWFCRNRLDGQIPDRAAAQHFNLEVNRNPIVVNEAALQVVNTHEIAAYKERLEQILAANGGVLSTEALKNFYDAKYFPDALIGPRLEMARRGITRENILSILGDLSHQETLRWFVGDRPNQILPDSLVGRYLAETGFQIQRRKFQEVHDGGPHREGPERLVLPVDQNSLATFLKYFLNEQYYSMMGHSNVVYGGEVIINGGGGKGPIRFAGQNVPLPLVLLKTTEGLRMKRYVQALMTNPGGWEAPQRAPWLIPAKGGGQYVSPRGGYYCCGHYQGNFPIGDKLVREIILPGADNQPIRAQVAEPDYDNRPHLDFLRNVWTYPMHEPVSAMLGLAKANGEGDFASAGWGIQTLLVQTTVERVPFVVMFTNDGKQALDANAALQFERPW